MSIDSPIARFIINGLAAAAVHFLLLTLMLEFWGFHSAGLANAIAACGGATTSFLGSRSFVFRARSRPLAPQATRFLALYVAMSMLHGGMMFLWSDVGRLDYRTGFLLGAALQAICTYHGGYRWVFRQPDA